MSNVYSIIKYKLSGGVMMMKEALYYNMLDESNIRCCLCPHYCMITDNNYGICGVRQNRLGKLYAESYGKITSIALDPIEKKPLYHFYPGSKILSIGSYRCNFHCGFCQNHEISMQEAPYRKYLPKEIADISMKYADEGNIGVAYTYNEPFISIEFIRDCAKLIYNEGQKNVLITNGYVNEEPLRELLPFIHAMNIDLKSFNPEFYKLIGGNISDVKRTIEIADNYCHIEITTLVITGVNDTEDEIDKLSEWLSNINKDIPLHISRFFSNYKFSHIPSTPIETVYRLADVAKKHLRNVYVGNC